MNASTWRRVLQKWKEAREGRQPERETARLATATPRHWLEQDPGGCGTLGELAGSRVQALQAGGLGRPGDGRGPLRSGDAHGCADLVRGRHLTCRARSVTRVLRNAATVGTALRPDEAPGNGISTPPGCSHRISSAIVPRLRSRARSACAWRAGNKPGGAATRRPQRFLTDASQPVQVAAHLQAHIRRHGPPARAEESDRGLKRTCTDML